MEEPNRPPTGPVTRAVPRDGIAHCGLYCEECFGHMGRIADLARDLRAELRKARLDRIAESLSAEPYFQVFSDWPASYEVLGALVKLRSRRMCKDGGGPPYFKIRRCSQGKGLAGCWEYDEFETCDNLRTLVAAHGDAHTRNLKKLRRSGIEGFISAPKHW